MEEQTEQDFDLGLGNLDFDMSFETDFDMSSICSIQILKIEMTIMNFLSGNIWIVAIIVVIIFFGIRYLYNSGYFKNLGLVQSETKVETLQEKQDKLKLLNEELKIKLVEDRINKLKGTKKSNGFFDTNVLEGFGGSDDFFSTDVSKDVLKGGKI